MCHLHAFETSLTDPRLQEVHLETASTRWADFGNRTQARVAAPTFIYHIRINFMGYRLSEVGHFGRACLLLTEDVKLQHMLFFLI